MTLGWAEVGVLVAVPSLLVAAVPRRWLPLAMLLWLVSPVIAYAGAIAWEVLTRPASAGYPAGSALYGLVLISSVLAVPWVVACLVGFGIGFGLRRLVRPSPARTARDRAAAPVQRPAPAPTSPAAPLPLPPAAVQAAAVSPGWRAVHVGFSNDGLQIGGVAVWDQRWHSAGEPPLLLPHPAHPGQTHRFGIYDVGEGSKSVRFAAAELSNGVWGFYAPGTHPVQTCGRSPDGSLRYEHRLGESVGGRFDSVGTWAVLIDAATDQVLVDCAVWDTSRITANGDGSLFLHLGQNAFEVLFRIDPAARRFHNHDEDGAGRTLHELADAAEQARRAASSPSRSPAYRRISPDGSIRVDLDAVEWGNSHWVHSPRVIEVANGRTVLDLWGTDWDAVVSFPGPQRVGLAFRRYHYGGALAVELDLASGTYRIVAEPGREGVLPAAPLSGLADALEAATGRARALAGAPVRAPAIGPHPLAAWRAALLLLLGAVAAIAAVAYVARLSSPPRTATLTPLPAMPAFPSTPAQADRR